MSASFVDIGRNREGLEPRAAQPADASCLHRGVVDGGAAAGFSAQRGHPVHPVKLPSRAVSLSVGDLAPHASTSNHRHAYESIVYVLEGAGHSLIEGQRFDWRAGDAFYTPPWAWHQHFAAATGARYLTATNMPMLEQLGQTVMRQEER